mmetsp:Transcript_15106/g.35028  ORF Transcript_15106/g.35028 Transcript_15106/m.35028 type:complete len:213 (-) Transcript_15106:77-715(-)
MFVDSRIYPSRKCGTARPADACGNAIVGEKNSVVGHCVDVGCLDVFIEFPQYLHSPVVGVKKCDVQTFLLLAAIFPNLSILLFFFFLIFLFFKKTEHINITVTVTVTVAIFFAFFKLLFCGRSRECFGILSSRLNFWNRFVLHSITDRVNRSMVLFQQAKVMESDYSHKSQKDEHHPFDVCIRNFSSAFTATVLHCFGKEDLEFSLVTCTSF